MIINILFKKCERLNFLFSANSFKHSWRAYPGEIQRLRISLTFNCDLHFFIDNYVYFIIKVFKRRFGRYDKNKNNIFL